MWHRVLWLTLLVLTFVVSSSAPFLSSWAQSPQLNEEREILKHLDIFLTSPSYRDLDEGVKISNDRAEIWFLESLDYGDLDSKVCQAARWVFSGRLARSQGAFELFKTLPQLQEISLVFYRVKTDVNPDLNGKYQQKRSPLPIARFSLSRSQAFRINVTQVSKMLQGPQCVQQAREFLSDLWISEKIYLRREELHKIAQERFARTKSLQKTQKVKRPPSPSAP